MIKKKYLIVIAGIVWFVAGFNILRIGIQASNGTWTIAMLLIAVVVFLLFHNIVFRRMVKKHVKRITDYEESKQPIYRFFNKQAYCIMAFMMTFGIGLRVSGVCPDIFIAVFYSGLGASLIIAGVSFEMNHFRLEDLTT